jgi:EmrB/QacA subfamily drug resistance transporter
VTGYALTFATFLIIGGRLGDVYGYRRTFMIGASLFGIGSLIAALSTSVIMLVGGEAIVEGIGAALMMPATLAILSTTFTGHERGAAFAAWGAVGGASAAFGPVIGGFLTTNYSWRWAFGINVIVAPLAIAGVALFTAKSTNRRASGRLDLPGALLISSAMFLLVFGISEGGTYGWWKPVKPLLIGSLDVWPSTRFVAITPIVFAAAAILFVAFYRIERRKERRKGDPLFEFGQLRHHGFRYGLFTTGIIALSQFGLIFVLPVFLQDAKHLSAWHNGLWQLPTGLFIVSGAQVGGRLTRRLTPTTVVRLGISLAAVGFALIGLAISPNLTFWSLLPGFAVYGFGAGFATSQLTNVILSDIPPDKAGVAGGASTTFRQVGGALGVATMGAIFSAVTIRRATSAVRTLSLPPDLKHQLLGSVREQGVSARPPAGTSAKDAASINHAIASAIASGARPALALTVLVAAIGALMSFLIPRVHHPSAAEPTGDGAITARDTAGPETVSVH